MSIARCLAAGQSALESRLESRWRIRRFAVVRIGYTEYPGVTEDLSASGLKVSLTGAEPRIGDPVTADVALDGALVRARGTVAYVLRRPGLNLVGLNCPGLKEGIL